MIKLTPQSQRQTTTLMSHDFLPKQKDDIELLRNFIVITNLSGKSDRLIFRSLSSFLLVR